MAFSSAPVARGNSAPSTSAKGLQLTGSVRVVTFALVPPALRHAACSLITLLTDDMAECSSEHFGGVGRDGEGIECGNASDLCSMRVARGPLGIAAVEGGGTGRRLAAVCCRMASALRRRWRRGAPPGERAASAPPRVAARTASSCFWKPACACSAVCSALSRSSVRKRLEGGLGGGGSGRDGIRPINIASHECRRSLRSGDGPGAKVTRLDGVAEEIGIIRQVVSLLFWGSWQGRNSWFHVV
jgi:hypothetical protein